jgi:hypothetical protein
MTVSGPESHKHATRFETSDRVNATSNAGKSSTCWRRDGCNDCSYRERIPNGARTHKHCIDKCQIYECKVFVNHAAIINVYDYFFAAMANNGEWHNASRNKRSSRARRSAVDCSWENIICASRDRNEWRIRPAHRNVTRCSVSAQNNDSASLLGTESPRCADCFVTRSADRFVEDLYWCVKAVCCALSQIMRVGNEKNPLRT